MNTTHKIFFKNSNRIDDVLAESIDLVVTSPPYPMIEMWDEIFSNQNNQIEKVLKENDGPAAFELMHCQLDKVWDELFRVLKPGGIACINIGDATRTINQHFSLYTNHARILTYMQKIGFSALPAILWRKQTNAPNKFMGSGMLPGGAYVTLEHEYILVLRKGNKREFTKKKAKQCRRESSYFWEERNHWFSDIWMDLKGASQILFNGKNRDRSGAFPFELPYRLISMYSVKGDTVLDPFLGLGTTMYAAMAAARNSVGIEIDAALKKLIFSKLKDVIDLSNQRNLKRLEDHMEFVAKRIEAKGSLKYENNYYQFPVVTRQEVDLIFDELKSVDLTDENGLKVSYADQPYQNYVGIWNGKN